MLEHHIADILTVCREAYDFASKIHQNIRSTLKNCKNADGTPLVVPSIVRHDVLTATRHSTEYLQQLLQGVLHHALALRREASDERMAFLKEEPNRTSRK
jgi:hypothetical protein